MIITEISRNEYDALALSLDKARLRKRLNEAKALLFDEARAMFKPGIFKPAERALYSDSPFGYRLQWTTRPYPDAPESEDNQQTSVGTVRLVRLDKPPAYAKSLEEWRCTECGMVNCRETGKH